MPVFSDREKQREYSIEELFTHAENYLGQAQPAADGRVRHVPDVRTIRFYQTLGVLDRPLSYHGRNAVYGFRHLAQLVAIKQLQREGFSLKSIQSGLAGRTTEQLEEKLSSFFSAIPSSSSQTKSKQAETVLAAHQLQPGVTLIIDESKVSDAARIVALFKKVLEAEEKL